MYSLVIEVKKNYIEKVSWVIDNFFLKIVKTVQIFRKVEFIRLGTLNICDDLLSTNEVLIIDIFNEI